MLSKTYPRAFVEAQEEQEQSVNNLMSLVTVIDLRVSTHSEISVLRWNHMSGNISSESGTNPRKVPDEVFP